MSKGKRKRVLYVRGFPGELGWEIVNYAPLVNWFVTTRERFDAVVVRVRRGREKLYPFGTKFYESNLPVGLDVGGNAGPRKCPVRMVEVADDSRRIKALVEKGYDCSVVDSSKLAPLKVHHKRVPFRYIAPGGSVAKWQKRLGARYIVLPVRLREWGKGKNWPLNKIQGLAEFIAGKGLTPVFVGNEGKLKVRGCVNLLGETAVNDLIPILTGALGCVGQSTGPQHLAAMCGTPHLVWGNSRLIQRYMADWNPLGTSVCFLSQQGWTPSVDFICNRFEKFYADIV